MSRCSSVDDVQLLQGWPPVAGPSGGARRAQLRELQMAARIAAQHGACWTGSGQG